MDGPYIVEVEDDWPECTDVCTSGQFNVGHGFAVGQENSWAIGGVDGVADLITKSRIKYSQKLNYIFISIYYLDTHKRI